MGVIKFEAQDIVQCGQTEIKLCKLSHYDKIKKNLLT